MTTGAVIPTVAPPVPMKLPTVADRTLANGLRVLAVRRPGIPRFEARLHIPTAQLASDDGSRRMVLSNALLSGTESRTSLQLAQELQRIGGSLDTMVDADQVVLFGSALAPNLGDHLALMADVLTGAMYPSDEVQLERARAAQEVLLARSQPATIAREAFLGRVYGTHPYGRGLPEPEAVGKVTPAALRSLHTKRLLPRGAVMVLVGDFRAATAVDRVETAFGDWADAGEQRMVATPKSPPLNGSVLVHRPGAVQTNVRIGGFAPRRGEPDHAAFTLANLVFGGYFSSRLVENIRERRGYTYSPGSVIQQHRAAAHVVVVADVGTEVTGPALVEMRYELGRIVATLATDEELEAAKRYLAGTIALSTQTQSGLANYLGTLALRGLGISYLREFPLEVARLGAEEVREAAWRYLAPRGLATVMVGDADRVKGALSAFDDLQVLDGAH
jgi:predicted Zn-dependent peptidase